jgi:hypothetical protein
MARMGLSSHSRLGDGRPSSRKLGPKRARTDRVEVTKPEDEVGPEALAGVYKLFSKKCRIVQPDGRFIDIGAYVLNGLIAA